VGLIAVRDSGPGIPASVRARLFEPFVTTRPEGTGLGLSIVKQLIDRQGGKVSLLERETGGTLAVVELPLAS
jgi:signal transduction histidine kinase